MGGCAYSLEGVHTHWGCTYSLEGVHTHWRVYILIGGCTYSLEGVHTHCKPVSLHFLVISIVPYIVMCTTCFFYCVLCCIL